jgi:hypothetical protein
LPSISSITRLGISRFDNSTPIKFHQLKQVTQVAELLYSPLETDLPAPTTRLAYRVFYLPADRFRINFKQCFDANTRRTYLARSHHFFDGKVDPANITAIFRRRVFFIPHDPLLRRQLDIDYT